MSPPRRPIADRFWSKVRRGAYDECWPWTGALNVNGYGLLVLSRSEGNGYAHRIAHELLVGPIPAGFSIDHLCGFRRCVNPAHLEAVPQGVNAARGNARKARKIVCPAGHPLLGDNLYDSPSGSRVCKQCTRDAGARYRARKRASR